MVLRHWPVTDLVTNTDKRTQEVRLRRKRWSKLRGHLCGASRSQINQLLLFAYQSPYCTMYTATLEYPIPAVPMYIQQTKSNCNRHYYYHTMAILYPSSWRTNTIQCCKKIAQFQYNTHSMNCFAVPDPNGVSAGQRWLVQGNSSARTMPIISFYSVDCSLVALGTLLHHLQCGTENWEKGV